MADLVGLGRITDRAAFAEHAAPEAVRAHLHAARQRAVHASAEVRWLEGLLDEKTAHLPHTHACVSCSPDGEQRGPGCINCRQTGFDQMPCQAEGHRSYCPVGCCDPRRAACAPYSGDAS